MWRPTGALVWDGGPRVSTCVCTCVCTARAASTSYDLGGRLLQVCMCLSSSLDRSARRCSTGRTQIASAYKLTTSMVLWYAVAEGETATTATKGTNGEGGSIRTIPSQSSQGCQSPFYHPSAMARPSADARSPTRSPERTMLATPAATQLEGVPID